MNNVIFFSNAFSLNVILIWLLFVFHQIKLDMKNVQQRFEVGDLYAKSNKKSISLARYEVLSKMQISADLFSLENKY